MVDRGANGGIAGDDVHVVCLSDRVVNVTGIENHQMNDLRIGTFMGVAKSNYGDVLVVLHQYAYHGQGRTIHSSPQMESFGIKVDDKSIKAGGTQTITAHHGFQFPLDIRDGLPYMPMRPPSAKERETLPQVVLTSDNDWDPRILDFNLSGSPEWNLPLGDQVPEP